MCFQPALNKTLCFTPPPPRYQTFKHSKLQNKKIRLSASALPPTPPHNWFSTEVYNIRIEKPILTLPLRETISDSCIELLL